MNKLDGIVQGSKEWLQHILTNDSTDGQRMFSSESYFDSFWEDAAHGVAIISAQGEVIQANPAFCQLLDIDVNEAIGMHIRDFVADGAWREDMRTIDTIACGRSAGTTTEERWKMRLNNNGPFIPVRIRASRIPSNKAKQFKHIILHVYDLRNVRYDMQGTNWGNKPLKELLKEILMNHFGKIVLFLLGICFFMALNGSLGEMIDKLITSLTQKQTPIYLQHPQISAPCPDTCTDPTHNHTPAAQTTTQKQ